MTRFARPLAVAMAVWTLVALVAAIVVAAIAKARGADIPEDAWAAVALVVGIGAPACVGLVLVLRRPDTRVAWILLAGALSVATVMAAFTVSGLALDDDPDSTLGAWAQVVAQEWTVLFLWPLALAYVFPDGRLPSRRWRPMAWIAGGVRHRHAGAAPAPADVRGPVRGDVDNPIGVGPGVADLLTPVFWACWFGLLASLFGGALLQRARYKAGSPEQRRQVLWLAYGALLAPLWLGGTSLLNLFVSIDAARPRGADARPRVARGRRGRRGDAPRPVRDRPPLQPHAGLRRC